MATHHRAEALKALEHAIERLASAEPLDGLAKSQLRASLEYAKEEVGRIQETKRARRTPAEV